MNVYPEFPENRINDPRRQAELAIYLGLQAADVIGKAIYEARPDRSRREVDFAIWLQDVARIALQVKGGRYRTDQGSWYLTTPNGEEKKPTPAKQAWDAALQEHINGNRNPFVLPVLVFPDMEPDADIEAWGAQAGIHVLFGPERLVERLVELAATARVYFPPTAEEIAEEVELVMPGVADPDEQEEGEATEARQDTIQGAAALEHAEEQHDQHEQHEHHAHHAEENDQEGEATEARQVNIHVGTVVNIYIR